MNKAMLELMYTIKEYALILAWLLLKNRIKGGGSYEKV